MENDRPFPPSVSLSSRPSSLRPQGARPAPLGPRIRQASTNSSTSLTLERRSSQRDSTVSKASTRSRESTSYSSGPASPARSEHDLPGISEQTVQPPANSSPENSGKVSRTPSFTFNESPVPSSAPSPSPSSSHAPNVKPISKSATLIPPPQVTFENVTVPWRGLPLEAALWTFDSRELQDIVSRAIRSSARESFIRLVSIKQLDETLPVELERLAALKATTQSKYRFNVHRRTMLLQALMSYSGSGSGSNGSGDKDGGTESLVSRLAEQLSDTTIECDKLAQELVQIVGKMSQINQLLDVHWASALAIALRKLNGSYGKRTADLLGARQRIEQLEAELDDAWREAERMAQEIDDLDNGGDSDLEVEEEGTIQIKKAEVVPVSMTNGLSSPQMKSGTLMNVKAAVKTPPMPSRAVPDLPEEGEEKGEEVEEQKESPEGVTQGPSADVAEPIDSTSPSSVPNAPVEDDRASVHSKRSVRSTKSNKSQVGASRVSHVTAARKRSVRTSLGALRLPGHARKISLLSSSGGVNPLSDGTPAPPVPEIPKVFTPATSNPPSAPESSLSYPPSAFSSFQSPSFLDLGSRNASAISLVDGEGTVSDSPSTSTSAPVVVPLLEPRPRRTEIDEISLDPIPLVPNRYNGTGERIGPTLVMDDLYVMPSGNEGVSNAHKQRKSVDDVNMMANSMRRAGTEPKSPGTTIPSIWLHADTPKTPAERVESLMRSQTNAGKGKGNSSYSKLKELTRRYSLPFPFHGSGSGKGSASSGPGLNKS